MTARRATTQSNSHKHADALKSAMRRMAATVCVVSSKDADGNMYAMTATSVTSLSLEPPTVLACVNQWSPVNASVKADNLFCINILDQSQQYVAEQCSRNQTGTEYLSKSPWAIHNNGLPYLPEGQASVFCKLERTVDYTTHSIFIGLVQDVLLNKKVSPLIYLDGEYREYESLQSKTREKP